MVQRQIFITTCDHCKSTQPNGSAEVTAVETVTLSFGEEQRRAVDLCADHAEEYRLIRAILRSRGRRPKAGELRRQR
jgi:hypothetical protein